MSKGNYANESTYEVGNNDGLEMDDIKHNADHVEAVAISRITESDLKRTAEEALTMWSATGFRLFLIMLVQGANQAGYGIDWAVIGGINAVDSWHTKLTSQLFNFATEGSVYGTFNALMNIGQVSAALFLGIADIPWIGRRGLNFFGNAFVAFACIFCAFSTGIPMFMAGRFLMGFGTALMSSSTYMAEISPVHLRGRMVGIFGACFQVGSLFMSGALIGLQKLPGNWGWQAPLLMQAIFPVFVCLTIYFWTPETPRHLVRIGKREEARAVVAKYHTTSGRLDEPIVELTIQGIDDALEHEKAISTPWWDYRVFYSKRVAYRLFVLALYSIFQSWNGGGIITYYLVPALKQVGITDATKQLGINFGLTATYFVFTTVGAFIVDKVTRRTLIFSGLAIIVVLQTAATITSWQYKVNPSTTSAALTILWIFMFQVFSSLLIATLHNLYPVEVLSLVLRAKGMGLYTLIQGAASAVQSYGISVGIEKLGYKIWCVYIIYNSVQLVLSYFVFPETFGLSLEEIDAVFETPGVNPVKMSLDIQKAKKSKSRLDTEGEGYTTGRNEL